MHGFGKKKKKSTISADFWRKIVRRRGYMNTTISLELLIDSSHANLRGGKGNTAVFKR